MGGNFDDEDPILGDITSEDLVQGMRNTTVFVSQTFLDRKHYQTIHQQLSRTWERSNSLSAALKLMETYGVTLSSSEQKQLEGMDEAQQISKLVAKMPQQSNEQFQQFFLQLQLLVSTAMRVRRSLEEGKPDEVSEALEDADATGIASYILNVAIVQAGSEVKTIKDQFQGFTVEAENKMGRLLRGQQDNITAQKQLKAAEAELQRQNKDQCVKAGKVVIRFWGGNNKAVKQLVMQGWAYASKMQRLEALVKVEYADRLQDLEDNLAKVKHGQVSNGEIIVLRRIQQDNIALLGTVFDSWRSDSHDTVFMRECGDKVKAMEEKLANTKASQKENAQKVLGSLASANDQGLLAQVLKNWIQVRQDTIKQEKASNDRAFAESKLDQFAKKKSDEAKYIIQQFLAETSSGLVSNCMIAWMEMWAEKKAEASIAEKMYRSKNKMDNFQEKNKKATGSLMNRASEHLVTLQLGRAFNAWKLDAKLELTIKTYHAKIDAKRGQLVGVQKMFKNFAEKLESGMNEKGPGSSRTFDNRSAKKGKKGEGSLPGGDGEGRGPRVSSGRKGVKGEGPEGVVPPISSGRKGMVNSVSLPDIQNQEPSDYKDVSAAKDGKDKHAILPMSRDSRPGSRGGRPGSRGRQGSRGRPGSRQAGGVDAVR